jgi:predicted membrane-bound dolichyl-phosphate-mannose-protein mannosyltransferase
VTETELIEQAPAAPPITPPKAWWRSTRVLLALILLVSGGATMLAMRRTSTTFDEIVMIAGGARGYHSGQWTIAPEHPPFTQYMYGFLPFVAGVNYPDESTTPPEVQAQMGYRYRYAQVFFWGTANNPERIAFLGRLPSMLCALLLATLAFVFVRRAYGDRAGLMAAAFVAFLPDLLAHGGVAYNDVPITLAYFFALWRIDEAVRKPSTARALGAGAAIGLALGIKNSAVALAPAAVLLLLAEGVVRRTDRDWWKRVVPAVALTAVAVYLTLVLIYRGDFALKEYQYALSFVFKQVTTTRAPSFLLGKVSTEGFWYYFPVAFLYKTSAGLHILLALSVIYFGSHVKSVQQLLRSPLRMPAIGALVFAALLLRSQLNIGFRYAMPLLPLIAVITAVGAAKIWESNWRQLRIVVTAASALLIVFPLTYYPNFLTYVSEYGPNRDRNYEVFADSSLDWGQGLLLLRDFMREHNVDRVYLSYFGSAWPAGYGIDYLPLFSFFQLPNPKPEPNRAPPRYAVISATNLTGTYFIGGDPFKQFREREPAYVLGHSLYVYEVQ